MFSWFFIGIFLAFKCPAPLYFVQIHSYFSIFKLLTPKTLSKGVCAVKTIAPLSFITLLYCCHNSSKGMIASHLLCVVPYGKSHKIISIDLSGIFFIPSKQSSLYILFNSIYFTLHMIIYAFLSNFTIFFTYFKT